MLILNKAVFATQLAKDYIIHQITNHVHNLNAKLEQNYIFPCNTSRLDHLTIAASFLADLLDPLFATPLFIFPFLTFLSLQNVFASISVLHFKRSIQNKGSHDGCYTKVTRYLSQRAQAIEYQEGQIYQKLRRGQINDPSLRQHYSLSLLSAIPQSQTFEGLFDPTNPICFN